MQALTHSLKKKRSLFFTYFSIFFFVIFVPGFLPASSVEAQLFLSVLSLTFIVGFLVGKIFKPPNELAPDQAKNIVKSSQAYQELLDEFTSCSLKLKRYQRWTVCWFFMGWSILILGYWSRLALYSHPMFAIPVFILALLAALQNFGKCMILDKCQVTHTIEGIAWEKSNSLKEPFFHNFATKRVGWSLFSYSFTRVAPVLLIIFSALNAGPLPFIVSSLFSGWVFLILAEILVGLAGVFLVRMISRLYFPLKDEVKKSLLMNS